MLNVDKKLSYGRGTARHVVSVETMQYVAQMFAELHLIKSCNRRMTFKVIGNGMNR